MRNELVSMICRQLPIDYCDRWNYLSNINPWIILCTCNLFYLILVYIEEIKEIRRGARSKDFQNPKDLRKIDDPKCCIVIVYGCNFRLKTLSCLGMYFFCNEAALQRCFYKKVLSSIVVLIKRCSENMQQI